MRARMVDVNDTLHHPPTLARHSLQHHRKSGEVVRTIRGLAIIATSACVLACGQLGQANGAQLGDMPANKILFLGNSITFCPQPTNAEDWWGLSASSADKDYAHVLTQKINAATGGSLAIVLPNPSQGSPEDTSTFGETRWRYGYPLPTYNGNILNLCDLFEINYNTWDNARIQNQIDSKPDIVVLQIGENMSGGTPAQFASALDSLLTALKNSSNPHIFVTSHILGANAAVDNIKRQICEQDPTHRVFVDLSGVHQDTSNLDATYGHPNDKGMQLIADKVFDAMVTHSVPEPTSIVLLSTALVAILGYAWRKRK